MGVIAAIATPTFSEPGAVYDGATGATRSTPSVRLTAPGAVYPAFDADTLTATPVPAMYAAFPGTATDQVAVSSASAPSGSSDVAVRVVAPTATDTDTPSSSPVSPEMLNPAAFSAMFTTLSSPAIAPTFSTSVAGRPNRHGRTSRWPLPSRPCPPP